MKSKLLIFLLIFVPVMAFAFTSPGKPSGFVNDFAEIINSNTEQSLEQKLTTLKGTTGFEVTVATVKSLNGDAIESFASSLFADWGIGQKGKDNGILLLVAPNEREVKIETGYGSEGVLTDLQSGNIIRNVILPAFKSGDYSKGISEGVDAVVSVLTNSPDAGQYSVESASTSANNVLDRFGPVILFFFFFGISVLARILGKTKSWWLGGVIGCVIGIVIGIIFSSVFTGVFFGIILAILGLIFDYFVSKNPPKSGRGGTGGIWPIFLGGRGGGGGFSGSGGFGGFGGGMSGGGGASGRW